MQNKSRVFISNENPRFNYNKAEAYGELVFLTDANFVFPKAAAMPSQSFNIDRFAEKLTSFDPSTDYLLLSGCPVLLGVIAHICFQHAKGFPVRLLQWAPKDQGYDVVTVKI